VEGRKGRRTRGRQRRRRVKAAVLVLELRGHMS